MEIIMAKASKNDAIEVKELKPKDPDLKYFGAEPSFAIQPTAENRLGILQRSFNWYNRFYSRKDAKEFVAHYLDFAGEKEKAKKIRTVPDNTIPTTLGWLARIKLRGLDLTEQESLRLQTEISRVLEVAKVVAKQEPVTAKESVRPNLQEIMKEKAREAGGEIEGLFDVYLKDGAKSTFTVKVIDEVAKLNVLPQHISIVIDPWNKKREEFEAVLEGNDDQLKEGYSQFTKTQVKNILKYIDQVISDLNSYVTIKKTSRAPRARKAVPVEKIVAKLKYLKTFKDEATKLDLVSLHPTKIHGASEAWVYDTAKRKLHHYIADEYSKTFTVKGNTLLGFDNRQSEIKTLRKPAEQLKEITGSKPAARKFFKEIKSVATTPNGRFNENMIILKAW